MKSPHLITRTELETWSEQRVQHQFNERAVRHTKTLSDPAGLARIGIHLVRIEPGHDSTTHHYHDSDEEFIYVVAGRGRARIGNDEYEVGAGDFMGFPAPSPAHSLHNPYEEDLVYLMGGERQLSDVVHYPDLKRSLIKSNNKRQWADWDHLYDSPR